MNKQKYLYSNKKTMIKIGIEFEYTLIASRKLSKPYLLE